LIVVAAFRAAREVGGELALAGAFDPDGIPYFLSECAGPSSIIMTEVPQPRPKGLDRPDITTSFSKGELEEWLNGASKGAGWPVIDGWTVLASTASFGRMSFRRELIESTLFLLRDNALDAASLPQALGMVPQLRVIDGLLPLYDEIAPGGIVSVQPDIAESVPTPLLLCPRLAEKVGLVSDLTNQFSYVDAAGNSAVKTIWWRDGGIRRHGGERPVRGEGSVILATAEAYETVKPFLGRARALHVWREAISNEGSSEERESRGFRELSTIV